MSISAIYRQTRSLGKNLRRKPCVSSRGHIFSLIIMKLGQNVCFDLVSNDFENGSCRVKNEVNRSNVRKTLCIL